MAPELTGPAMTGVSPSKIGRREMVFILEELSGHDFNKTGQARGLIIVLGNTFSRFVVRILARKWQTTLL